MKRIKIIALGILTYAIFHSPQVYPESPKFKRKIKKLCEALRDEDFGIFKKPRATYRYEIDGPERARKNYEDAFETLIEEVFHAKKRRFFRDYLINNRKKGRSTHVLDVMGSALFIEDQSITDSIAGLRRESLDLQGIPKKYQRDKYPPEILGDVFHPLTWETELNNYMRKNNIPAFDLVTMLPIIAWRTMLRINLDRSMIALGIICRQVVQRLSKHGVFLFTVRAQYFEDPFENKHFKELQSDILNKTNHKLILIPYMHGAKVKMLDGAIVPKDFKPSQL